jgi:hypothetical protein|tara:strand:+ start:8639 stop:9202 length:564 start_codon:yes stop_codon:yes gene_type:complete
MGLIIKESNNFLSAEHKKTIETLTEQGKFPFFMAPAFGKKIAYPNLSHILLKRPEDKTPEDRTFPSKYTNTNVFNSPAADVFLEFLFAFCDKFKIKINKIFRANVNLTFNIGIKQCPPHVDHTFPHKQLIIYLNDCDKNAKTVLMEKNKVKHIITPEKYKGVLFKKCPHYLIYPKKGARIIAIYTFD